MEKRNDNQCWSFHGKKTARQNYIDTIILYLQQSRLCFYQLLLFLKCKPLIQFHIAETTTLPAILTIFMKTTDTRPTPHLHLAINSDDRWPKSSQPEIISSTAKYIFPTHYKIDQTFSVI